MTLCYVTKPPFMSDHTPSDPYVELCVACYAKYVVDRGSLLRRIAWRTKRLIGIGGPV